jgi:nicotinate-nucleotide adenylyltransferase
VKRRRLGVFGGTFDPPHHGHLIAASDAYAALRLDRLLLVPAADPPHKKGAVHASAEQRLRMLRAAVAGDPRFEVVELELRRAGPSYTVDTLRELRGLEPDAELVFLLGIDQFRALESWREPETVASLARLGVLSRDGESPVTGGRFPAEHVPITRVDISATEIRRRAAAGESIRYLVPEAVRAIVEEEGLYRGDVQAASREVTPGGPRSGNG